jgi:hypothetical protein
MLAAITWYARAASCAVWVMGPLFIMEFSLRVAKGTRPKVVARPWRPGHQWW